MQFDTILLEQADGIAVLTLNQPASRNGLTGKMQAEILSALDHLARHGDAHALILTGAGKSFCSGADLGKLQAGENTSLGAVVAKEMEEFSNPLIMALNSLPIPVIAAINGAAAGAGAGIALAADMAICARSAFFLIPFLPRLGIVPDMGTTYFLPQRLGRARAMGLMLLGDRLPAEKAEQWGLVWSCVDDARLMEEAMTVARRLANLPAHAVLEARSALDMASRNDLAAQLHYEMERQSELLDLPSFKEGVQAFFEKRDPVFRR
jgi:2-(1,2-epoxy-1,2-dihydrophenyl)acetyl-CoA isomerase